MARVTVIARVAALAVLVPVLLLAQVPASVGARDFVRRQYVHGVPYEGALRLPPNSQGILFELLNTPQEQPWWANAAQTLGAIGDQRAAGVLVDFVRKGEGKIDPDAYNAKTTAIFSLGWWLNRHPDPAILDFLRAGLTPGTWNDRVTWQSPYTEDRSERNDRLAFASMRALGISGRPEAAAALKAVQQQDVGAFSSRLQKTAQSVLDDAIRVSDEVRSRGSLRSYLAAIAR